MKHTFVLPCIGLFFLLATASQAVQYQMINLGDCQLNGVNSIGQIVGTTASGHAFMWQNGSVTDLGPGGATAINDSAQIVGYANGRAVVWDDGAAIDPGVPDGIEFRAINNCGQIVGVEHTFGSLHKAFLLQENELTYLIPDDWGSESDAYAINDNGQVAGSIGCESFVWRSGDVTVLGLFGGPIPEYSYAFDINDRGQAVGEAALLAGQYDRSPRPFLWDNGAMIDLGTLGGSSGWALGINDGAQVVGYAQLPDGPYGEMIYHAFLWNAGTMTDIGTLPGDTYSSACAINNKGWIIGESDDGHVRHAVLWIPVPEPSTITALFAGLVSFCGLTSKRRRG